MKNLLTLMLLVLLCQGAYGRLMVVADQDDRLPLAGASVFSGSGLIIGITDPDGTISVTQNQLPISIRALGYEPATIHDSVPDTAFVNPATYSLAEITVMTAERPITRVVTYAREYCTGATDADTLQLYSEYMLEYFFADGKVKGYNKQHQMPNILAQRRIGRSVSSESGDSIMRPTEDDDLSLLSFLTNMARVPYEPAKMSKALLAGARSDTIMGKFYPQTIGRVSNGHFILDIDLLADIKDHTFNPWFFKLLGFTMKMKEFNWSVIYAENGTDTYSLNDFIFNTATMRILGTGKLLRRILKVKEPITMYCYVEQYPVDVEHITVDEYTELKKSMRKRREPFVLPDNVQPLPGAVEHLAQLMP